METRTLQFNGLNYRRFSEPFSLEKLFIENLRDMSGTGFDGQPFYPMLEDFSDVGMDHIRPSDITEYVMKLKNSSRLPPPPEDSYIACVAGDLISFGKLRMYGVYSDIFHLRNESDFHVADTLQEATSWLADRKGMTSDVTIEAVEHFRSAA